MNAREECLPRDVHLPPGTDRHLSKHNFSTTTVADGNDKKTSLSSSANGPLVHYRISSLNWCDVI